MKRNAKIKTIIEYSRFSRLKQNNKKILVKNWKQKKTETNSTMLLIGKKATSIHFCLSVWCARGVHLWFLLSVLYETSKWIKTAMAMVQTLKKPIRQIWSINEQKPKSMYFINSITLSFVGLTVDVRTESMHVTGCNRFLGLRITYDGEKKLWFDNWEKRNKNRLVYLCTSCT